MVCMANCLSVYDSVSSGLPIHLIVIHYTQINNLKRVIRIVQVDITNSSQLLFGTITRLELEELDKSVKSVPSNKKPTKEQYDTMYNIRNNLQKKSGAIRLNIKCDSKQSRLQCSFNKFQAFLDNNPTRIIEKSNTNIFRGGFITKELISQRRILTKK
jgi:hypothetical protein